MPGGLSPAAPKRLPAVLALATLLALGMSPAAWADAQGGLGGEGEGAGIGGNGGGTSVTGPTAGEPGGGGGGTGGPAGTLGSPNGGNGGSFTGDETGGGGGGGGYAGLQSTSSLANPSGTTLTGGTGGQGGGAFFGGGGGGGAGGNGVNLSASTGTSTNAGTLVGGAGGAGGESEFFNGGGGGQGGSGIAIAPASATTFVNTGTITGGNGGAGGIIFGQGANGGIGIEVVGNGVTILNYGTVSGGAGGTGFAAPNGAEGFAIHISGNNNTLVLEPGYVITSDYVGATGTNNTLSLGGTGTATFDTSEIGVNGQYKTFNTITKTGSSNWTLLFGNTDDSTPWTVEAGTITVDATHAFGEGAVTQTGGTITTTGLGGMQIAIGSNFVQQTGSTLALKVASATVYDTLAVTGTATLGGTLNLAFTGSYTPAHGQTFTVVTATDGITGLSNLYVNPETNLAALHLKATGSLTNGGDNLVETISATQQDFVGLFGGRYLTPNQQAVASNIDGYINRNTSGNYGPLVTALDNVSYSPNVLGGAFNQLMPLNFARFSSSTAFNNTSFLAQQMDDYFANHRGADGSFLSSAGGIDYSGLSYDDSGVDQGLQQIHSRLLAWNPAPSTGLLDDSSTPVLGGIDMKDTKSMTCCSSEEAPRVNFFVAGNAVLAQDFSDANTGLSHDDTTTGAIQLGADYAITPHLLVGALFGFGHTDADLDNIGSTASVDTYSPGVYASYSDKGWYANALGTYGFSDYNQHRNIQFGGLDGTAQSNPDGDQIVGDLDGGYDFHQGHLTFGPTLGVQYVHLEVDGYNEYGLPAADLNVNDDQADSLRSRVGGHLSYAMKSGGVVYTPHFAASWQHEFLDQSRGITSQFDGLGAGSFVVQTQSPSRDSALLDMGLDAEINKTITVFGDYTVQAGQSNYFGQSIQAGVKVGF